MPKACRQSCTPAEGDRGYQSRCRYLDQGDAFLETIASERPLAGEPLARVIGWQRPVANSGCYCHPEGRLHKWGLVFETIHYALAQREPAAAAASTEEALA
ncbi:MAG TPA: hypothetical protein PKC18_09795 [Lacipirellulaceae bacterium]|mgnify:FL=1|nr:hypothetical protein [Lacipirellulaceae bacterium]